ncbi:hypothetical protein HX99_00830 [Peptococcaceae bacterium SCADC1_2_3]|nr:hypothetical protein DK28_0203795 [Peptococcaceae bacterium SCADC1_2_3]KFI34699.1 hypothetical protein HX99_00830 [Peptococcaceae bacterium SCADC1_2_3]
MIHPHESLVQLSYIFFTFNLYFFSILGNFFNPDPSGFNIRLSFFEEKLTKSLLPKGEPKNVPFLGALNLTPLKSRMEICKEGTGKTSAGEIEPFPKEGMRRHWS